MEIDMVAEARLLASGFEKGMTAFGESIERGLKAIAESMAQDEKTNPCAPSTMVQRYAEVLQVECEEDEPHEEHYALVWGVPQRCSGKGRKTMREVHCLSSYAHLSHEWTISRGSVSEEVYCPGKP